MEFENKKLRSVAEAAARIMMGEKALHPNQQKLDVYEPEKDKLTADDFKKLRTMKKEETMQEGIKDEPHEIVHKDTGKTVSTHKNYKDAYSAYQDLSKASDHAIGHIPKKTNEEVESVEEADTLLARTGMNSAHKFPRAGQTNLKNIPAMNTPGNSKETDDYAEKRRGDRAKQLKPAIKAALGTHGPKGKLPEEVDLDESKMAQLDSDLKDLSHNDFHKEYGKPKSHYDPSNFKKPVQKGQEMNRARALAQRAMASMKKEEVELTLEDYSYEELEEFMMSEEFKQLDELNKDTLYSYVKKSEKDQDDQFKKVGKGIRDNNPKSANKAGHKFSMRSIGQGRAENRLAKEEYEELEEMFPGTPEYEKKYGKAPQDMKKGEKKKTTQGEMEKTGKGVVHRRKFSEMVESYTEGGIKGLFKTLAEEPTSAEFDAQLDDAKKRAAGTKKQPEVSKPAVQAVQNEEVELTLEDFTPEELEDFMQTEEYEQLDELSKNTIKKYHAEGVESVDEQTHTTVSFIDYNDVNGVKYAEIDLSKKN